MFRPCIDLHEGKVKQIVGGSLSDNPATLKTNYISPRPSAWYAALYKRDNLRGGHLIMLGPGNERAAVEALDAYPGGLQIGGGLNQENVRDYLNRGASHVIVTSALFEKDKLSLPRLKELSAMIGKERLVVDLSCRKRGADYWVVTNRWQTLTDLKLNPETFGLLGKYCDEFLIHAADVEGLCQGIDLELVENLAAWTTRPTTYAGGAKSMDDLKLGTRAGKGKIDITIGSALDIFGGNGVRYRDVVRFNRKAIAGKNAG